MIVGGGRRPPLYYTSPSLPGAHRRACPDGGMTDWLPGAPKPNRTRSLAGPGGGKAVHHERIIARPDEPDGSGNAGGVKMCITTRSPAPRLLIWSPPGSKATRPKTIASREDA
jgi:hypothetical protein